MPTYNPQQAEKLYEQSLRPGPTPDGLVILTRDTCPHCHDTMVNTGYRTRTPAGVPVTWINLNDPNSAQELKELGIPFTKDSAGHLTPTGIADDPYMGVPVIARVRGGRAVDTLSIGALKSEADLDAVARGERKEAADQLMGKATQAGKNCPTVQGQQGTTAADMQRLMAGGSQPAPGQNCR